MPENKPTNTSVRKYFVDKFFFENSDLIQGEVIDIGGKKKRKRGSFDINTVSAQVTYVNIEESTNPDILASAENIPVNDGSFDTAIMRELLEHVQDPKKILRECHRLLRKSGTLLITVPFMIGIHGDPQDYGRYTESYWEMVAKETHFSIQKIERQGSIFAVLALMIQHIFLAKGVSWRPIQTPLVNLLMWIDTKTKASLLKAWTTGYSIVLKK